MPLAIRDLNEPQQLLVGDVPPLLLPVMKFRHGVKLVIIELVHGLEICPLIDVKGMRRRVEANST